MKTAPRWNNGTAKWKGKSPRWNKNKIYSPNSTPENKIKETNEIGVGRTPGESDGGAENLRRKGKENADCDWVKSGEKK